MSPFVNVAGWTLIHFVWQGAAVALIAAAALRLARHRSANARYLIACAGLAGALAAPVTTVALLLPATTTASADIANVDGRAGATRAVTSSANTIFGTPQVTAASPSAPGELRIDQVIRGIVIAWVIGVALLLGRMGAGWWHVRQLHRLALSRRRPAGKRRAPGLPRGSA